MWASPDGVEAQHDRPALVVGKMADTVDQPAHRVDRPSRDEAVHEPVRQREGPGGLVEGLGVEQLRPQRRVSRIDGHGERERPPVRRHRQVEQIAQVPRQLDEFVSPDDGVPVDCRAVPPGQVDDAGVVTFLLDPGTQLGQPGCHRCPSARSRDHRGRGNHLAGRQTNAADRWDRAAAGATTDAPCASGTPGGLGTLDGLDALDALDALERPQRPQRPAASRPARRRAGSPSVLRPQPA